MIQPPVLIEMKLITLQYSSIENYDCPRMEVE